MRKSRFALLAAVLSLIASAALSSPAGAQVAETKVSVAGPTTPYLPNAVNEPALAVDANHPQVLAAGANDLVDSSPCKGSSCDLTPDIGISGDLLLLRRRRHVDAADLHRADGTDRHHPRRADPHPAELLRARDVLPRRPGAGLRPEARPGGFSWANGSRLYYANLAFPLTSGRRLHGRLGGRGLAHR